MLKWLLGNPRDDQFYRIFEKLSDYGLQCADVFSGIFSNAPDIHERIKKVEDFEHRGDALIDEAYAILDRTFITTIDQTDIIALVDELDDVLDSMKRAALYIRDSRANNPPAEAREFTEIILQMTHALSDLVAAMPRAKSCAEKVRDRFKLINALEEKGDDLFHRAVSNLWSDVHEAGILDAAGSVRLINLERAVKWERIFGRLEDVTDHCEHAAKKILSIIEKGS